MSSKRSVQDRLMLFEVGRTWSNKLWDLLDEESLDQVFVMEVSLRLVEHDEMYSERLGIVNFTKSMDLR
ncbi:hypothetical protein A2U01_0108113 [Trifolium medium]|uniref:Uncharacterized protein n=1 Tax=Trifolium medium TaxID=97028 RepID=A0A392VHE1_9FABA|nr:hypothetical protein [Trifolium medium]